MNSILIANRGEIALRIIRTCKKLKITSIAIYSEADRDSYYTKVADAAVCIGPTKAEKSYLNIEAIIAVAKTYNVDAIHPGIGFLSENVEFQKACHKEDIIFIGPNERSMELLGDKAQARKLMIKNNIPVPAGSNGEVQWFNEAEKLSKEIGFPIILKASHGGGGGGIRIVHDEKEFANAYNLVKKEALASFGSESIYLEQYLENTRHIEVQILADGKGNVRHFGTRECSIQRKNQKLIEEAPAPFLSPKLRRDIENCAVKIAKITAYENAGTVEFLLTEDNKFYFMEMNTRLQVEHTVTESVYGIDLVKSQIQVALSHELVLDQSDIKAKGHAIECRINAEDPSNNFAPSPGKITQLTLPGGYGIRVDSGYICNDTISPFYDSLVLKIICSGLQRAEALATSIVALEELDIKGIKTNASFAKSILTHEDYIRGSVNTKWIENTLMKQTFNKIGET